MLNFEKICQMQKNDPCANLYPYQTSCKKMLKMWTLGFFKIHNHS